MANETTTSTMNDVTLAAVVDTQIQEELRPYNVMRPFFKYRGAGPSSAFDFPKQDDEGAAPTKSEAGETTEVAISDTKATATAGTVGHMTAVTDELSAISLINMREHVAAVLARNVAEKRETDYTALVDDFSNTTGTSGVDLVAADLLTAVTSMANRDVVGQPVAVLHTQQAGDIKQDLVSTTAAAFSSQVMVNGVLASELNGFAGELFGIPIYQTSLVPTANAGADRAGAVFIAGEALGLYEIWGPRVEVERNASLGATEVVVTSRYGVVEVHDARGQSIITDA